LWRSGDIIFSLLVSQARRLSGGGEKKEKSHFLGLNPLPLFSGLCFQRILAWLPHEMKQNVVRVSFGFEGPGTKD